MCISVKAIKLKWTLSLKIDVVHMSGLTHHDGSVRQNMRYCWPTIIPFQSVWKIMQWIKLNQKLWKPPEHQSCCFFSSKVNIWVNKFPAIWMHLLKSVFRRNRKLYSSETRPSLQKKRKKSQHLFPWKMSRLWTEKNSKEMFTKKDKASFVCLVFWWCKSNLFRCTCCLK